MNKKNQGRPATTQRAVEKSLRWAKERKEDRPRPADTARSWYFGASFPKGSLKITSQTTSQLPSFWVDCGRRVIKITVAFEQFFGKADTRAVLPNKHKWKHIAIIGPQVGDDWPLEETEYNHTGQVDEAVQILAHCRNYHRRQHANLKFIFHIVLLANKCRLTNEFRLTSKPNLWKKYLRKKRIPFLQFWSAFSRVTSSNISRFPIRHLCITIACNDIKKSTRMIGQF